MAAGEDAGDELSARAQAALDLVCRDAVACDRFTKAYTGTGDALLALRAAADPVSSIPGEQLDALRRIAFGRTRSAVEETAALAARQVLYDDKRVRAQNADALDRAIHALGETGGAGHSPAPPPPPDAGPAVTRPTGVLRRIWIAPIAALCLVVGYGSAAFSRHSTSAPPSPPAAHAETVQQFAVVDPPKATNAGWTIAAEEWFSTPQLEEDTVDAPAVVNDLGIDPATTRLMGTTVHGALLWIAKGTNRSYCIVGMRPWNGGAFGLCTTVANFRRGGLELTQGLDSVRWDGIKFTTSSTTSAIG